MTDFEVAIERLAFGGAGIGRCGGKACFVPFSTPGDLARVRVTREKGSYMEARLVELIEPSPQRTEPLCPVFGSCGGCDWQHLQYSEQCRWKAEIVAELLQRIARVDSSVIDYVLPSPSSYDYRSRIQLKVRYVLGELHIGFYRGGSHFVIDLPDCDCAVAHPSVNRVVTSLRSFLEGFPEPDRLPQVDVAAGDDGRAGVVFHYIGSRVNEIARFLRDNPLEPGTVTATALQHGRKSTLRMIAGDSRLTYRVPAGFLPAMNEITLGFSLGGFSQVNYRQNLELLSTVHGWAGLRGTDRILDLFCGNGNFTLPLASGVKEAVGVESYGPSITDANANAAANGAGNTVFHCADVAEWVTTLANKGERFDVVLLDPPRTGAGAVAGELHRLGPRAILYVSCDPATLARDAAILARSGYQPTRCRVVDMFPQTYHIESVTLFVSHDVNKVQG